MRALAAGAAVAFALTATDAGAGPPPRAGTPAHVRGRSATDPSRGREADPEKAEGQDLLDSVPWIASFDFAWTMALTAGWVMSARSWDTPQPEGILGLVAARVLYGTTWSVLLTTEVAVVRLISDDWSFLSEAWWATDRLFGFGLPGGCDAVGASGGCGLGLGSFSELRGKLRGSPLWASIGGGWIQGRYAATARGTLVESTWVLSPMTLQAEASARLGALSARIAAGPGLYFGMHNAHLHPETDSKERVDAPWHEFFPLDTGAGAGLRIEAHAGFPGGVRLEGEAVAAPFPLRGRHEPSEVAPLGAPRGDGITVWRSLSAGLSVRIPPSDLRVGLRAWGAELSPRPVFDLGHRAVMLRWDIPLRATP